jgi:hypothetical protein
MVASSPCWTAFTWTGSQKPHESPRKALGMRRRQGPGIFMVDPKKISGKDHVLSVRTSIWPRIRSGSRRTNRTFPKSVVRLGCKRSAELQFKPATCKKVESEPMTWPREFGRDPKKDLTLFFFPTGPGSVPSGGRLGEPFWSPHDRVRPGMARDPDLLTDAQMRCIYLDRPLRCDWLHRLP